MLKIAKSQEVLQILTTQKAKVSLSESESLIAEIFLLSTVEPPDTL